MNITYDEAMNIFVTNLYTLSKNNEKILLKNFNYNNVKHRVLLEAANILSNLTGWSIYYDETFFRRIIFRIKGNKIKVNYCKDPGTDKNCDDIINDFEKFYGVTLLINLYEEYYGGKYH